MKKVRLKALDLGAAELLDAEQQKVTFGSGSGSGSGSGGYTHCSCTLVSSNGQSLTLPQGTTENWTTESECQQNCQAWCDGANQGGSGSGSGSGSSDGGCDHINWQFISAS